MNFPIVFRLLSLILLVVSLFMLFPIAFGIAYGEISTLSAFYLPMAATILIAVVVLLLTSRIQRNRFSYRDAFFFVSVSWIGASLLGGMPFVISGYIPRIADAFFETMSGFTTTGATILTEIESLPKSILFWRSLTHWLGGMGIVVLIVAIFPMLGMGGFQVVKAEMPGPSVDRITPKITGTAKILWFIYMMFMAFRRSHKAAPYRNGYLVFIIFLAGWFIIHSTSSQQFYFNAVPLRVIPQAVFLGAGVVFYNLSRLPRIRKND